jgi:hypothetical protein
MTPSYRRGNESIICRTIMGLVNGSCLTGHLRNFKGLKISLYDTKTYIHGVHLAHENETPQKSVPRSKSHLNLFL